jgi:hypothetical protein
MPVVKEEFECLVKYFRRILRYPLFLAGSTYLRSYRIYRYYIIIFLSSAFIVFWFYCRKFRGQRSCSVQATKFFRWTFFARSAELTASKTEIATETKLARYQIFEKFQDS